MRNTPATSGYNKLLTDIGRLYESTQQALAEAYWKIGRRIVQVEQKGASRAPHGDRLLAQLSTDLSEKYGPGFSVPNIERMRNFYLTHPKSSAPRKLTWTQYVELLAVGDGKARRQLERRAASEGLSSREIRRLVREKSGGTTHEATATHVTTRRARPLRRPRNMKLLTYRLADAPGVKVPRGHILVDCGFFVYRSVPKSTRGFHIAPKPSYTYTAIVERVVDGDTVWAMIDIGLNTVLRKKLRLHGIDAAELTTRAGDEARDYVAGLLPPGAAIVIRSYTTDAYGRFLADIFCPEEPETEPSAKTFKRIINKGVFLNQNLVARKLAVRTVM